MIINYLLLTIYIFNLPLLFIRKFDFIKITFKFNFYYKESVKSSDILLLLRSCKNCNIEDLWFVFIHKELDFEKLVFLLNFVFVSEDALFSISFSIVNVILGKFFVVVFPFEI